VTSPVRGNRAAGCVLRTAASPHGDAGAHAHAPPWRRSRDLGSIFHVRSVGGLDSPPTGGHTMSNVTANLSIGERSRATRLTVKTSRRHHEEGRSHPGHRAGHDRRPRRSRQPRSDLRRARSTRRPARPSYLHTPVREYYLTGPEHTDNALHRQTEIRPTNPTAAPANRPKGVHRDCRNRNTTASGERHDRATPVPRRDQRCGDR